MIGGLMMVSRKQVPQLMKLHNCNQTELQQGNDNEVTHYQPNPTAKNIPVNKQVDSWSSFSDADDSPTGNAGKSTFARATSGFGLRLSPKSPAADDILEGTSSTSQSGIFGKLTKSENIISMGFPADDMSSGFIGYVEGFYHNHVEEVTKFFLDPSQEQEDMKNVVVMHCKAGMARTGLMISSLIMHLKLFPTAEESIDYYNQNKTLPYKFHKPFKIQERIGKVMKTLVSMLRNFQQHLQDLDVSIKFGTSRHLSYDRALQAVEGNREKLVENEHDPLFISSRFERLELKLESVSVLDYRSILQTQVKSYMRAHLEDLHEKDATGMFEAANRVLNQLLIEMDGMAAKKTVFIIGTTNMPDIINPELPSLRCLDQLIYIPFPDKASHLQIFKACWPKPRAPKNVDLIVRAQYTRVFIGANITEICLRARKYTTY
ncbi:hypothetical protein Peur_020129 [Populus x canadensis]